MSSLLTPFSRLANWVSDRIITIVANLTYCTVESVAFTFSKPAAAALIVAELGAFAYLAGAKLPVKVALRTVMAVGTLRAGQVLFHSLYHQSRLGAATGLESIWEWEPPGQDSNQSSSWHILRQLAMTANKLRADNPAIAELLRQPALASNELGMRFFFYYLTSDERPLLESAWLEEDGPMPSPRELGVQGLPEGLRPQLAHYRDLTCQLYYYNTDDTLSAALTERGYTLLAASHAANLTNGCPAYCLCMSEPRKEVVLLIRGTFSAEDAFVDLLATGSPFDEDDSACCSDGLAAEGGSSSSTAAAEQRLEGYCHSGMGRAALFLGRKYGPLLKPLHNEGFSIQIVGHSLGAGVASMLTVYLRNRGLEPDRLHCWAFEAPACMDVALAQACADIVTSTVHADDVVPRLCIRSFAGLLRELAAFDWRSAAARKLHGEPRELAVAEHLSQLLGWLLGTRSNGNGNGNGSGSSAAAGEQGGAGGNAAQGAAEGILQSAAQVALDTHGFDRPYNAHVPGRVVLMYRQPGSEASSSSSSSATAAASSSGASITASNGWEYGLAVVSCVHPAVRRMRVSSRMIMDHFADTQVFIDVLGG